MKKVSFLLLAVILVTACVSKKKYVALEHENGQIKSELTKTQFEKEELETKFAKIEERVEAYNAKINTLTEENDVKMEAVGDVAVISNDTKKQMRNTLKNVDQNKLRQATTLKDSMNLAVSYNLQRSLDNSTLNEDEDIAIDIDETVVMISISDKMLFDTASYRISSKANNILQKLANVINSEPSIEVMVEGHTDARSIHTPKIADNWDLSVLRATSVVRALQNKYNVNPEKLIASGRSSYLPVAGNDTKEDRSKNRRTRIVILPNINKFFALMASNE
ncbi:Outer membrane protein Omp38 precursor [Mariniflexile rhizosphaerae]|uniref:OmpA/MotB family protein n=1 Tax=unclassified Mariniflexile TaxID=2643887 RepID=UPI000CCB863C|nr:OmpA family protein [Mariniflexile sp. TRM1-10]AXP82485.1 Outer membrane protein Omp38 precursor [Mariniflexile sp. TRM1-10]PLB17815.1 MAG: Flagellar motor rotation protein MotB [Flavobacteriaceae bacterium FS1-H7996/R]